MSRRTGRHFLEQAAATAATVAAVPWIAAPWIASAAPQPAAQPAHVVIPEFNNPRRAFAIHEALDRGGFNSGAIERIMGGNWTRVLTDCLG